jgi:hypothetical protein
MRWHYDVKGVKTLFVGLFASQKINHHRSFSLSGAPDYRHEKRTIRQRGFDLLMDWFIANQFGGLELEFT